MEKAIKILEKLLRQRCCIDDDLPCYQQDVEKVIKILKDIQNA